MQVAPKLLVYLFNKEQQDEAIYIFIYLFITSLDNHHRSEQIVTIGVPIHEIQLQVHLSV